MIHLQSSAVRKLLFMTDVPLSFIANQNSEGSKLENQVESFKTLQFHDRSDEWKEANNGSRF